MMEQFTAAEAAHMAEAAMALDGPYGISATEHQLDRIRGCARAGQRQTSMCGVPTMFVDIVCKRLEAVGFKIEKVCGFKPEDTYINITW